MHIGANLKRLYIRIALENLASELWGRMENAVFYTARWLLLAADGRLNYVLFTTGIASGITMRTACDVGN